MCAFPSSLPQSLHQEGHALAVQISWFLNQETCRARSLVSLYFLLSLPAVAAGENLSAPSYFPPFEPPCLSCLILARLLLAQIGYWRQVSVITTAMTPVIAKPQDGKGLQYILFVLNTCHACPPPKACRMNLSQSWRTFCDGELSPKMVEVGISGRSCFRNYPSKTLWLRGCLRAM